MVKLTLYNSQKQLFSTWGYHQIFTTTCSIYFGQNQMVCNIICWILFNYNNFDKWIANGIKSMFIPCSHVNTQNNACGCTFFNKLRYTLALHTTCCLSSTSLFFTCNDRMDKCFHVTIILWRHTLISSCPGGSKLSVKIS